MTMEPAPPRLEGTAAALAGGLRALQSSGQPISVASSSVPPLPSFPSGEMGSRDEGKVLAADALAVVEAIFCSAGLVSPSLVRLAASEENSSTYAPVTAAPSLALPEPEQAHNLSDSVAVPVDGGEAVRGPRLDVGGVEVELQYDREMIVGRIPGAEGLVVDDPTVSRRHSAVHWTEAGVVVRDLASSNGTQIIRGNSRLVVDGTPVLLQTGDTVASGDVTLFTLKRFESKAR